VQDEERVGLFDEEDGEHEDSMEDAVRSIADIPNMHWQQSAQFLGKPLKNVRSYMPPLTGALFALSHCVYSSLSSSTSLHAR